MKNKIFNISIIILIGIVAILTIHYLCTPKDGELIEIDYQTLLEKVDDKENFILLISQSTCSHCATYKPKLKTIAKDYGIDIFYIDYDLESKNNREKLLNDFNLDGATPVTMFFEDGKEKSILNRIEGDLSSTKVLEKFKKMGFID